MFDASSYPGGYNISCKGYDDGSVWITTPPQEETEVTDINGILMTERLPEQILLTGWIILLPEPIICRQLTGKVVQN